MDSHVYNRHDCCRGAVAVDWQSTVTVTLTLMWTTLDYKVAVTKSLTTSEIEHGIHLLSGILTSCDAALQVQF